MTHCRRQAVPRVPMHTRGRASLLTDREPGIPSTQPAAGAFPPMHRLSDSFLSLEEWREIDRRAVETARKRVAALLTRTMTWASWIVYGGATRQMLRQIREEMVREPTTRLPAPVWPWMERWLKIRRKKGLFLIKEAPLFCTTHISTEFTNGRPHCWPRILPLREMDMDLKVVGKALCVGRLLPKALNKVPGAEHVRWVPRNG